MATSQQTHGLILQHASWVQGLANAATPEQAVVLITTAMFHVSGVGHTTKKTVPGVTNTKASGTVQLVLLPTKLLLHFWETSADQKTWTVALETEHVKDKLSGLTPGQTVYFPVENRYQVGNGLAPNGPRAPAGRTASRCEWEAERNVARIRRRPWV